MYLRPLKPKKTLNGAYLKEKISREDIELFKSNFKDLFNKIDDKADEEHLKSLVTHFLQNTYYNKSQNQISPKGKTDLLIHTGKLPSDPIGVIVEVKSPSNKNEMVADNKVNVKAFHELVLYYFEERITKNQNELKQLVITNIYEWYIIDANEFDKKIYRNTAIKKLYELKKSDNKDNPWFYDELKKLLDKNSDFVVDATYFDIRDYKKKIINDDKQDDKDLIALFKILSPVHLLKLPFANDSNTLQPKFYSELLHLIGLYEYKEGSKKLITRKKEGDRNRGSLLENTIIQLDSHDKISRLDKPSQYGENHGERLYNVALELVITWINRILFLKLLEAQLINYHKGDRSYTFLNKEKIKDFDDLDKLFFRVLAKRANERDADIQTLFNKVPYLNSSLFEPTELEHQTIFINSLENAVAVPLISSTVLKDKKGKTLKGDLHILDYLFEFLNAYDFSSEGAEEIQEDNKILINASVLGLIFEKINGYKDGSFFTPGFITMYMCRETIRRAIVQKFNEAKGWDCKEYDELYDKIDDKKEANKIINDLKICDPAVGSGHFLVSALNEIIAIKSDLKVLQYHKRNPNDSDRSMRDYEIDVENDELIIRDDNGDIFEYSPQNAESQKVQETLFHEKQTIIENCLFGVDINPNSAKICRLRLWIELLKNAYYKQDSTELETLPNIDINIKVGNSLISRFGLDADLKQALRGSKWNINDYRIAVASYKNATDKDSKRELVNLIDTMKSNFRSSILNNGKEYKDLSKLRGQLDKLIGSNEDLFGVKRNKKDLELERRRLELSIETQTTKIEEIKSNKIFQNAFEWRFEFPEVLNDIGDFIGFDAIIGNPPYGIKFNSSELKILETVYSSFEYQANSYVLFFEKGFEILKNQGFLDYITPATFTYQTYFKKIRGIFRKNSIFRVRKFLFEVFEDADIGDSVLILSKKGKRTSSDIINLHFSTLLEQVLKSVSINDFFLNDDVFDLNTTNLNTFNIYKNSSLLGSISNIIVGIKPYQVGKGKPKQTKEIVISKIFTSNTPQDSTYLLCVNGKDFHRYCFLHEPKMYLKYGGWLAEPRESAPFFEDKIILRQTSDSIIAHFDSTKSINLNNVYNIGQLDKQFNIKYVLGILNSSLINYLYQNISQEKGRVFAEVKKVYLEKIPIYNANNHDQLKIAGLVDRIIDFKNTNPYEDTLTLEKEINELVYRLYNLTKEEISIVEGVYY